MKTKNLLSGFTVLFLIGILFIGCRKNNVDSQQVPEQITTATTVKDARDFFEHSMQNLRKNVDPNVRQSVTKTPLWDRAYEIKMADGQKGVIVPLKFEKQLSLKTESAEKSLKLANTSNLLIRMGETKSAEVITTIPGSSLKNNTLNLSEITISEDWAGNVLRKSAIKDNRMYQFGNKVGAVKVNSISLNSNQCLYIVWELCDYINGVTSNCEFVGTESLGCNESLQPVDDSGSCEVVDPEGGAHTTGDDAGESVTVVDTYHKDRVMSWRCVESNSWYLTSFEAGRVQLVDVTNNIWNWESFTHSTVIFNGSVSGGTLTIGSVVAAPSYTAGTQGVIYATMQLYIPITYTSYAYQCAMQAGGIQGALASIFFPPKTKTYDPHKVWNAKP